MLLNFGKSVTTLALSGKTAQSMVKKQNQSKRNAYLDLHYPKVISYNTILTGLYVVRKYHCGSLSMKMVNIPCKNTDQSTEKASNSHSENGNLSKFQPSKIRIWKSEMHQFLDKSEELLLFKDTYSRKPFLHTRSNRWRQRRF